MRVESSYMVYAQVILVLSCCCCLPGTNSFSSLQQHHQHIRIPVTKLSSIYSTTSSSFRLYCDKTNDTPPGIQKVAVGPPSSSSKLSSLPPPSKNELSTSMTLQEKIQFVKNNEHLEEKEEDKLKSEIKVIIQQMEKEYATKTSESDDEKDEDDFSSSSSSSPLLKRFQPAYGLYNVSYVQSKQKNENPVGGKWTRKRSKNNNDNSNINSRSSRLKKKLQNIISIRRTMQHLLPVNDTSIGRDNVNCTILVDQKSKGDDDDNENISETKKNTIQQKCYENRPVVTEAVNVITLSVFWNLIRLHIMLRGDAVPLTIEERMYAPTKLLMKSKDKMKDDDGASVSSVSSGKPLTNLAVKAFFDPPRIVFGKKGKFLNLQIGPKSSVILDTTYLDDDVDDNNNDGNTNNANTNKNNGIRIGKGGTSGTRFVFTRCDKSDTEANDFKSLLQIKPMGKSKLLTLLGMMTIVSTRIGFFGGPTAAAGIEALIPSTTSTARTLFKVVGVNTSKAIAIITSLMFAGILVSTGGIEQDDGQEETIDR